MMVARKSRCRAILCALLALVMSGAAMADFITIQNPYLAASLGTTGKVKYGSDEWDVTGRWSVSTRLGDPDNPGDDNVGLVYLASLSPAYYFGYWKIKVGDKIRMLGDTSTGSWSKSPVLQDPPPAGLGLGKTGGYIEAEWAFTEADINMRVGIRMSLVRDLVRFETTLKNVGVARQNVGMALTGDVTVEDTDSIGFPFLPGVGYTVSTTGKREVYPALLTGAAIPDLIDIYDNVQSPTVVARNVLKLQDATPPDYVALGEWSETSTASFWMGGPNGWKPDPTTPIRDLNWVLQWNQKPLSPGATRKIITYYGVGAASAAWTQNLGPNLVHDSAVLAVQGPRSLEYDSTTLAQNDLSPSPFDVKAYVYNLTTDPGPYNLEDLTLSIFLPPGLELVDPNTAQQEVGRVEINSESKPVTWEVRATGEYCGELKYQVAARDNTTGWQQVVTRSITVPATKKSVFRHNWQMMHVPFNFNNQNIEHVFPLTLGTFGARYYDPVRGQYFPVTKVKPGQAFWMYVGGIARGSTQPFAVAADAAIVGEQLGKQVWDSYVELKAGWNLIGNPLVYPVYWGQVLVYNEATKTVVSLDQAVANNWISKTLFAWNPDKWAYDNVKDNWSLLSPWTGYWVRAKTPCKLVFRPAIFPESDVTSMVGGF
jgi:hypothetical protein